MGNTGEAVMRWSAVGWVSLLAAAMGGWDVLAEAGTITGKATATGARGVRDAVVYIDRIEGKTFEPPSEPAQIDQVKKTYVPHVLPILKGGSVTFLNSDALLHNVHAYQGRKSLFNQATPAGGKPLTKTFPEAGEVAVLCDVHPEMSAYILVLETPYAAVTTEDGHYTIVGVPPGTYTLKTWHETLRPVSRTVSLQGEQSATIDLELK